MRSAINVSVLHPIESITESINYKEQSAPMAKIAPNLISVIGSLNINCQLRPSKCISCVILLTNAENN